MKKLFFFLLLSLFCNEAQAYTQLIDCSADGSHALTSTKATQAYACTAISGGGGSPGGSTNDIQYNAGSSTFGGITLTNGQLVVGQTASTPLAKSVSGDATLAASGALTIANNAVTLAKLATQATNTVLGNATSGTAVPTALAVGSCSSASSALNWTTNTGFGCNTSITANTATTATNATNTAITNDTTTNATMFPTWVTANTGNLPQKVTDSKFTFNPSTGVLSSTSFTGAGTGLTGTGASFTAGTVTTNANLTGPITSSGNATSIASQTGTGTKFVVDTSPTIATPTILLSDGGTSTAATIATTGHNTSGTPAAGFGSLIQHQLQDSTTPNTNAADDTLTWATATHASRKARKVFNIYDTAAREALRLEASGSAAMIGFLGANAAVQQTGDAGTALVTNGLMSGTPTFAIANLTGAGSGILTWLATPSSANLRSALTDENGTGAALFDSATSPTFVTGATVPKIIGGTGTTSTLTIQPTSGVGTTNADIIFKNGNNGGTEVGRILNSSAVRFGSDTSADLSGNLLISAYTATTNGTARYTFVALDSSSQAVGTGGGFIAGASDGVNERDAAGLYAYKINNTSGNYSFGMHLFHRLNGSSPTDVLNSDPVANTATFFPGIVSAGTKFTLSGAGCTTGTTVGGAIAGKFTSSTTGVCTTTITMGGATGVTAPNGWSCFVSDITTGVAGAQSASSATTAQIKVTTTSGDIVQFGCIGF